MGIVTEFRQLQDDVKRLNTSAINSASTGVASVNATTAGIYSSSSAGFVTFGCTSYSSESALAGDFNKGSIKLTSGTGSSAVAVKRGNNKIPFSAALVTTSGTYAQPLLDANFAWIATTSETTPAYHAIARYGNGKAIVCVVPSSGGTGQRVLKDVVTDVQLAYGEAEGNTSIKLVCTKETLYYYGWWNASDV